MQLNIPHQNLEEKVNSLSTFSVKEELSSGQSPLDSNQLINSNTDMHNQLQRQPVVFQETVKKF